MCALTRNDVLLRRCSLSQLGFRRSALQVYAGHQPVLRALDFVSTKLTNYMKRLNPVYVHYMFSNIIANTVAKSHCPTIGRTDSYLAFQNLSKAFWCEAESFCNLVGRA